MPKVQLSRQRYRQLRKLTAFASLSVMGCLCFAPASYGENIVGEGVTLRALDKVTAATEDFNVAVGDTLQFGSLEITVRHCEKAPPEETPETYVFVQITDLGVDYQQSSSKDDATRVFSGWMFGSNPALSSLEHPVYDVWPIGCRVPIEGLRGRE